MQSKNSTEFQGDLLEERLPPVDNPGSVPSKSPRLPIHSPPIPHTPDESPECSSYISETHSPAADTSSSHKEQLVPAADSMPLAAPASPLAKLGDENAADSPSRLKRLRVRRSKSPDSQIMFPPSSKRFIRRREVQHLTGLSRSSLYRLIAEKDFPQAIALSPNTVAWLESEIGAWILDRVSAPPKPKPAKKSSRISKNDFQEANLPSSSTVAPCEPKSSAGIPGHVSTPRQPEPANKSSKAEG